MFQHLGFMCKICGNHIAKLALLFIDTSVLNVAFTMKTDDSYDIITAYVIVFSKETDVTYYSIKQYIQKDPHTSLLAEL